jgi:hypothetical protein
LLVKVNVKETPVPEAVALAEMVIAETELIWVIVVLAGIPVPLIPMPTANVAVLGIAVIEAEALVVVPVVTNVAEITPLDSPLGFAARLDAAISLPKEISVTLAAAKLLKP